MINIQGLDSTDNGAQGPMPQGHGPGDDMPRQQDRSHMTAGDGDGGDVAASVVECEMRMLYEIHCALRIVTNC